MEGSPHLGKEEADKDYENTHLKEKENGIAYFQEGIFFDQEPEPINGDLLKQLLHKSLGALTFLNKSNQLGFGSGVLISRDVVLTAAHNIVDRSTNSENTEFKFYLGADGEAEEYYQVEAWRYPEEFKAHSSSPKLSYDYAIMKLKKHVVFDKYLPLSLACAECLLKHNENLTLQVYGFPSAYPHGHSEQSRDFKDNFKPIQPQGEQIKLNQHGLARRGRITVIEADQCKIGYAISTLPGQSGCPVVVGDNIIAVHVGGDKGKFNVGRIVDASLVNSLWKWREELNAVPFVLNDNNVCPHARQTMEKMGYKLYLQQKGLKSVDLWEYGNFLELDLYLNKLRQIDLGQCPRLTMINLGCNQLQRIDLTNQKHLTYLKLSSNQLQEIDVRANVNLTHLDLSNNKLQEMDVRANANISYLDLSLNQLQEMDVRANANLTQLHLRNNKLQEIDVRANVNLTYLGLSSNQLQEMDVRANVNLTFLVLHYNRIRELDLTKNTKLERLLLQQNRLARVSLWIAENVREGMYTGCFSLSNQQSAACRVQLLYEGQAIRGKTIRIVDKLMKQCSDRQYNKHNCAYSFLAF